MGCGWTTELPSLDGEKINLDVRVVFLAMVSPLGVFTYQVGHRMVGDLISSSPWFRHLYVREIHKLGLLEGHTLHTCSRNTPIRVSGRAYFADVFEKYAN